MQFLFLQLPLLVQQYIFNMLSIKHQLMFRRLCKHTYTKLKIYKLTDIEICKKIPFWFLKSAVFSNLKHLHVKNKNYTYSNINEIFKLPFASFLKSFRINMKYSLKLLNIKNILGLKKLHCYCFEENVNINLFKNLKYLKVKESGIINNITINLKNLRYLNCCDSLKIDFKHLTNLKCLNITFAKLTDTDISNLNLNCLTISYGSKISTLVNFKNLKKIICYIIPDYLLQELPVLPLEKIVIKDTSNLTQTLIDALILKVKIIVLYIKNLHVTQIDNLGGRIIQTPTHEFYFTKFIKFYEESYSYFTTKYIFWF